ncbi:MAG: Hsp20 family protein [Kiloniellaceae bacterium]
MRTMDLSPLLRATVGFDRMMNLLDAATRLDEGALSYPPYNIEKTGEDAYRIVMAVAGFGEDDLDVTVKESSLVISGKKDKAEAEDANVKYLHRGIATRAFERRFDLADHIKVTGARLENGLLYIDLVHEVPEAMKPRRIKVETAAPSARKVIEGKAA